MKKSLKTLITASLLTLTALPLVACGSSTNKDTTGDTIHVGILQYMEHDSLTAARKGFLAELEENVLYSSLDDFHEISLVEGY